MIHDEGQGFLSICLLGRVEVYGVGIGGRRSDIESGNKIVKPFPTESEPASRAVLDAAKS